MSAPGSTDVSVVPSPGGPRAVFTDESGRRARWAVFAGRAVGGLCLVYVSLVAASLLGAPWVPHEVLPSVGPAPHVDTAVTLPPSASRQPAPSLPTRRTTTTGAPVARSTTTSRSTAPSTAPSSTPGRSPGTTTTSTVPASTTTTVGSTPGASAPGRIRHG